MHGDVVLGAQLVAQGISYKVIARELRRGAPPQDRLDRVYESRVELRRFAVERPVWKSNFRRPALSARCDPRQCIWALGWRFYATNAEVPT